MPFGITNAPIMFMDMMNRMFMAMLDWSMIMFIDDILVFSKTTDQREEHLKQVLEVLRRQMLYVKSSKCEFCLCEVQFFGHRINQKGILVNPSKIEEVM